MDHLSLKDLFLEGKKVLMRVDFNVPFDEKGAISDDSRLLAALPSIRYVLENGGSLILMSHLGRPKGKFLEKFSLEPVAKRLSELLDNLVLFLPDCIGDEVNKNAKSLRPGEIILLENLRFYEAEELPEKDPSFAKKIASLGNCYVNDAFGAAHRAHASIVELPSFFKGSAAMGFLLEKEITVLDGVVKNPVRPFYALIGGAKISSKMGVLKALMKKADALFIGGGMTYTFMKAQGISIGNSIYEEAFISKAQELLMLNSEGKGKLLLPKDIVVCKGFKDVESRKIIKYDEGIPEGYEGVDIGPETIREYAKELNKGATIFWNGPLGVFEIPEFAKGTYAMAQVLVDTQAITIVGGGDSIAALKASGVSDKITHLSTGGGASLEYIEYGTLPGIDVL